MRNAARRPTPPSNYVTKVQGVTYSLDDRHTKLMASHGSGDTTEQLRWSQRTGYFIAKCTPVNGVFSVDVAPIQEAEAYDLAKRWGTPLPEYQRSDAFTKVVRSEFTKHAKE